MAGCGKTCLRVLAQYLATARCLTVPPRRERTVVIAIPAAVINHLFLIPIPNKRVKSIRPRPGRQGWQSAFPQKSTESVCRNAAVSLIQSRVATMRREAYSLTHVG